jgi:peptidoglycan DL-endopeptidase CwlO
VTAPAAELRALRASLGSGDVDTAARGLEVAHTAAADVGDALRRAWAATAWHGVGAGAGAAHTEATADALDVLARRADELGAAASSASTAVRRGRARLDAIIAAFETLAASLPETPEGKARLAAAAAHALDEARAVVDELADELDGHTATVADADPGPPAATIPAAIPAGAGAAGMAAAPLTGAASGLRAVAPATGAMPTGRARPTPRPDAFGQDLAVHVPGGEDATAPNAVAASAVRHALTQLGVPYVWGGTAPGVGLDCSGLTQWAYHEAGLDLPRLAQEQDVGAPVSRGDLRPGDLAVWDGHVAMVVDGSHMIEAGDPVQLSPIRTTNAGQGFQGFWRPTA